MNGQKKFEGLGAIQAGNLQGFIERGGSQHNFQADVLVVRNSEQAGVPDKYDITIFHRSGDQNKLFEQAEGWSKRGTQGAYYKPVTAIRAQLGNLSTPETRDASGANIPSGPAKNGGFSR